MDFIFITDRKRLLEVVDELHQGLALLDGDTLTHLAAHQPTLARRPSGLTLSSWERGQSRIEQIISNLAEILKGEIREASQTTQLILARLDWNSNTIQYKISPRCFLVTM